MTPREELLAAIVEDPDLCDLGYDYAEVDRRGYCLWVIDCAKHVLPLAKRHLDDLQMMQLEQALDRGLKYLTHQAEVIDLTQAVDIVRGLANTYCEVHEGVPNYLAETLEACANALELLMPGSKVYHEDVIYAAARAAYAGQLHAGDSSDLSEDSDCNDTDDREGFEESELEIQWQRQALKARLLEGST